MRLRTAVVAVALLLPSVATAQLREPRVGQPRPQMPEGRQPEAIARAQQLVRSRYSVEVYPLISRVKAGGVSEGSPTSSWTSFGTGTRLDWRHSDHLSWTIDVTVSYLGGSAITETAEVGTRIRPKNWNDRVRPFADLRVGFEQVSQDLSLGAASIRTSEVRYGRGFGAVAGAGVEYFLTNTLGLTTAVSAMRSRMTAYRYTGVTTSTTESSYPMSTYRVSVGLKYTPVRYLRPPNPTTH